MANPPGSTWKKLIKLLYYHEGRGSPNEARHILLVVATLIASVTFQAGVSPPGSVWQDNKEGRVAGQAIYASREVPFYFFLVSNTLAFSSSILIIICLTFGYPFYFETLLATLSMVITYGSSIFAVTPNKVKLRYLLLSALVPVLFRILIEVAKRIIDRRWPREIKMER